MNATLVYGKFGFLGISRKVFEKNVEIFVKKLSYERRNKLWGRQNIKRNKIKKMFDLLIKKKNNKTRRLFLKFSSS